MDTPADNFDTRDRGDRHPQDRATTADDVRALHSCGWPVYGRDAVGVLLAEVDRLRALLEAGAEQVHGMGRELRVLRRQLEDARRDAGAFLRELEQL